MPRPRYVVALLALTVASVVPSASAQHASASVLSAIKPAELTGSLRLACEAVLCLAGSARPAECKPSLKRFFSIKRLKLSDTLKARQSFLGLCPAAGADGQMSSLVKAMARGAGRCDAAQLNKTLSYQMSEEENFRRAISNQLPSYCAAWIQHAYVQGSAALPRYVGKPESDGFWVESGQYESALARYEQERAAKQAERHEGSWGRRQNHGL